LRHSLLRAGFKPAPTRSLLLSLTGDQCFDKLSIPSPVEDRLPLRLSTLCYLPSAIWLSALSSLLFALLLQLCEKSLPLQFCNDAVIHEFGRLLVSE
jgi:hypothetical protein